MHHKGLLLGKTFPFEGNWNCRCKSFRLSINESWERPSRLKGIETQPLLFVWLLFPLPRWERPSRLKGIETTGFMILRRYWKHLLGKTFPFEGNWNRMTYWKMCFCGRGWVGKDLPVWRELKLCVRYSQARVPFRLGKTFPFEGNWNIGNRVFFIHLVVLLGKTFPFEGNWNTIFQTLSNTSSIKVEEVLPVWRELKLKGFDVLPVVLVIGWGSPSRLKGIETEEWRSQG